jgi:hypothetical protein
MQRALGHRDRPSIDRGLAEIPGCAVNREAPQGKEARYLIQLKTYPAVFDTVKNYTKPD